MMNKQEFDNKRKSLTTVQKADFEHFLQSKSDDEIAKIRGVDRSSVTRNINNIAKMFGIKPEKDIKGKAIEKNVQKFKLLELCLTHIPEEVKQPHIYDQLVSRSEITNLVTRPQPPITPQNIPTPKSIPELTTLEFIGRNGDLTELANRRNQYKIVLIKAGAGVGKSTLAREFLQTQFKKVIRIEMGLESGNVTPAEEKVSQILRKDFDEEPSRDFGINLDILREKLADRTNPIGVLIDNLEPALDENYRFREKLRGYDALLAVLGDRDVCSFTLITSRRSLTTLRAKVHKYLLEGLDITAWRQYFHDCENGADSEALLQMRDAYNGNAKVMDILHGAIKNRFDGNIGAYWSRYKDALLADSELETLISVEMDWLRDNQPDAYKLLCRMGCYRYQDVKTVPFEGLICLLWDVPESRRACVINYLSKTSLIEVKGEYYLHPAIREIAKSHLLKNKVDWENANQQGAEFWTSIAKIVETITDALTAFEAYYHYIEIDSFELSGKVIVKMRANKWEDNEPLGRAFYRLGLTRQMIISINKVIDKINLSYTLSRLYNILGDCYWLAGNIIKSIESHQQSGIIANQCMQISSETIHIFWLIRLQRYSLFNTGLCKIELWEIEEAINLFEQVVALWDNDNLYQHGFYENESLTDAWACIAFLKSCLNIQKESYDFVTKAGNNLLISDLDSWAKGYVPLFLGLTYKNLKEIKSSFEMYNHAIKYAEEAHYSQVKGKGLTGLAELYRIKNDFEIAIAHHYESIKILDKVDTKCDLAEAYFQLGLTYQAMGEHDQAEEYKVKALELFEQMEAPKQIERVNKAFEQGGM